MGLAPSCHICDDCDDSFDHAHPLPEGPKRPSFTLAGVYPAQKGALTRIYKLGKYLGHGKFGQVTSAKRLDNNQRRAIKTVVTVHSNAVLESNLCLEILNLSMLNHPNIIRLYTVFETAAAVHLVMDHCNGGDLFDRVEEMDKQTVYSENTIAQWIHQMLLAISHCHNHGICHRDVKPENFIFKDKSPESPIILCDFGLSANFRVRNRRARLRGVVGTCYYVAPEVLANETYSEAIDVWGIGVILHVLLSGQPPYGGRHDADILDAIQNNKRTVPPRKIWKHVSLDAKELIELMLERDPEKRITVHDALSNRWVVYHGDGMLPPSKQPAISLATLQNLQSFGASQRLKKAALQWIANFSDTEDIKGLRDSFRALDRDGNGVVTLMELHTSLSELKGLSVDVANALKLFMDVDMNGSGGIEYNEFLAAAWSARHQITLQDLQRAFEHFDTDHSGYITVEDLRLLYQKQDGEIMQARKQSELAAMLDAADTNGDGKVDYKEFLACVEDTGS